MARTVIEVMVENILAKWERITGRKPGDAGCVAPETSSTLSIVYALQDLDKRLQKLESWYQGWQKGDETEEEARARLAD